MIHSEPPQEKKYMKEDNDMAGLMIFNKIEDALKAGFQIYDRTADGYLVRTKTDHGWAMAFVKIQK